MLLKAFYNVVLLAFVWYVSFMPLFASYACC